MSTQIEQTQRLNHEPHLASFQEHMDKATNMLAFVHDNQRVLEYTPTPDSGLPTEEVTVAAFYMNRSDVEGGVWRVKRGDAPPVMLVGTPTTNGNIKYSFTRRVAGEEGKPTQVALSEAEALEYATLLMYGSDVSADFRARHAKVGGRGILGKLFIRPSR